MTENEIIVYLKENKNKGVAFGFMPSEVKDWCIKHRFDRILDEFDDDAWIVPDRALLCYSSDIYCLPEEYELKPEFKAHYEEFEIKNGFFIVNPLDKDDYDDDSPKVYHWWEWTKFLSDNSTRYNNFGGWVYEDPISEDGKKAELLVVSPRILRPRGLTSCTLFNCKDELKPAWPTKILFWRHAE